MFSRLAVNRLTVNKWRALLFFIWLTVFLFFAAEPIALFFDYGMYAFLGVIGAIFANSTGAGGGVVFVPFFAHLEFAPENILATSFAIQCFGMTAGSITWMSFYRTHKATNSQWQSLLPILLLTIPFSLLSLTTTQWLEWAEPKSLHQTFAMFSIVLALAIFASVPLLKRDNNREVLSRLDIVMLPLICLIGGVITAWLSVGVGELVAIYLIFRRFDTSFSIACAVVLSGFTVWGGVMYHLLVSQAVIWPLVAFAGLGAVVGGVLAKRVVLYFSATNLKLFFASWVLFSGIVSVPV
ncbi:sulfite exporter TauE/SafE family protein [Paraneptunicella aestuarii]|uniref:sulfite exporter TauE/SafE family protein n=1 Tax=Paraneptunicella aestuarii TaxID=2831148 RepID=UPI0038CD32E2